MLQRKNNIPSFTHQGMGIYIHVPFCQRKCHYCDFYSVASPSLRSSYVGALCNELQLQARQWSQAVRTIYFGGGTPSQLSAKELHTIMECITTNYECSDVNEVTMEVNPDDITPHYLAAVHSAGINRLSIGIQSFDDNMLLFLNRRHNAAQALLAVELARKEGFTNISIDLMFGLPQQTLAQWEQTLTIAFKTGAEHISAYHLSYEEGTPLHQQLAEGSIECTNEETSLRLFRTLMQRMNEAGYQQYEISNYALPGFESIHNSAYWDGTPYLGVGPSAHSFDGTNRFSNPSSLNEYITALAANSLPALKEPLTHTERYNEFVITALRQRHGMSLDILAQRFGTRYAQYCMTQAQQHITNGLIELSEQILRLTQEGIMISDSIFIDLILTDDND